MFQDFVIVDFELDESMVDWYHFRDIDYIKIDSQLLTGHVNHFREAVLWQASLSFSLKFWYFVQDWRYVNDCTILDTFDQYFQFDYLYCDSTYFE